MKGQKKACDFYGCNKVFVQTKAGHRFCSTSCRVRNNNVKHGRSALPDFNSMGKDNRGVAKASHQIVLPPKYDRTPIISISNMSTNTLYSTIRNWFSGQHISGDGVIKIAGDIAATNIIMPVFGRLRERMLSVNSLKSQADILQAQKDYCKLILIDLEKGVFPAGKLAFTGLGFGVGKSVAPREGFFSYAIPLATTLGGLFLGHQMIDKQAQNRLTASEEWLRSQATERIADIDKMLIDIEHEKEGIKGLIDDGVLDDAGDGYYTISEDAKKKVESYKMSAYDYRKLSIPGLPFDGEFYYLFDQPAPGFLALIYGKSGHGKTTFSLRFADYLESFGKVNYVNREQGGQSKAFQDLLNEHNINITQIDSELLEGVEDMSKHGEGFDFIILDSVSYMKLTPDAIQVFRKENPAVSIIGIMQCTKDGKMKGSEEFAHNADIVVEVENFIAKTNKNRFSKSTGAEIPTVPR